MRVAGIEQFGGAVHTLQVAKPRALGEDEVLIGVKAAGVGNWDDIVRRGDWDVGRTPPMALGVEAAGVIAALGHGVGRWSVGDEVLTYPLPFADQGTWAPRLIARVELLARKPAGLSWAIAAAFPVPALTAVQVIDEALRLQAGETLLVNGRRRDRRADRLTRRVARRPCAGHGRPSSHDRVSRAGATNIVDYHDREWREQILAATGGRGVDAAANAARGGAATALRAVRDGGRLATITSDAPERERGIEVSAVYVRPDGRQLERASQELGAGRLEFRLGAQLPVPEADAALAQAMAGRGGAVALEL